MDDYGCWNMKRSRLKADNCLNDCFIENPHIYLNINNDKQLIYVDIIFNNNNK